MHILFTHNQTLGNKLHADASYEMSTELCPALRTRDGHNKGSQKVLKIAVQEKYRLLCTLTNLQSEVIKANTEV